LEKSHWIHSPISVGIDLTGIKKAAPLFLEPDDLETFGTRLDAAVKAQRKQKSGFYLELDEGENPAKLQLDDLMPKYQKRFQWGEAPGAKGEDKKKSDPSAVLKRLREKTNADGTRLYYLSADGKMLTFFFNPVFPPDELTHYPELLVDVDRAI